jgi:hypothetical protein
MLFPVISATDDLCAMRTEMEESPAGKRTVRPAGADKTAPWKLQSPPALAATTIPWIMDDAGWQPVIPPAFAVPAAPSIERTGRAPPSFLG